MSVTANPNDFDAKDKLAQMTLAPGVYRFFDEQGDVLYVGKAASLKKRVASYFTATPKSTRLTRMVMQIRDIEVTITRTEAEALLLENQLIKSLKPRYNVLLRDDKSYPYIRIGTEHPWPRVKMYRGSTSDGALYFGPYPSVSAVREFLGHVHRLFGLRGCEDTVFANRSRPCLQHQIERCSAPCVGVIDAEAYQQSIQRTKLFLEGKSDRLTKDLEADMQAASQALAFERAASIRDVIAKIRSVQSKQFVDGQKADMDVLAVAVDRHLACVVLLSFREGANLGTRSFFPKVTGNAEAAEVLVAFLSQYYLSHVAPKEIIVSHPPEDKMLLQEVFAERVGHKVQIKSRVRGERAGYLALAGRNADHALQAQLASSQTQTMRINALTEALRLDEAPKRMECFDISHTQGEATVASCVVFDAEGPVRAQYRRYNISGITPGDDYAAMQQVLLRRFKRAAKDGIQPDVLFVDGGKGQLTQAREVLTELGIVDVVVIGVAKGEGRKPGLETLFRLDGSTVDVASTSPALHLIQHIRDEAHRFAITGHRGKRAKARQHSVLEDIEGVGAKRRSLLLKHFGGLVGLKKAGVDDIARVGGVGDVLAARIYATLHGTDPETHS